MQGGLVHRDQVRRGWCGGVRGGIQQSGRRQSVECDRRRYVQMVEVMEVGQVNVLVMIVGAKI